MSLSPPALFGLPPLPAGAIRIAHLADLHFGRRHLNRSEGADNLRELDIYRAGHAAAQAICQLQPDLVVMAGDVWDTNHPTSLALRHGYDLHRSLRAAELPVVVIGGNHDTLATQGRPTPLEHLARYFDCTVVLEQQEVEMAGVRLLCAPYRAVSTGLVEWDYSEEVPNLLLAHATVDVPGFRWAKFDAHLLPASELEEERVALTLLGHIHIHEQVAPGSFYSGSPERLNWGEIGNQPAFWVHDLGGDGSVSSHSVLIKDLGVPLTPRPVAQLEIQCGELDGPGAIAAAQARLEKLDLEEGLLSLRLLGAHPELLQLPWMEELQRAWRARGILECRTRPEFRSVEGLLSLGLSAGEEGGSNPLSELPGGALSNSYEAYANERGEDELAELGAALIAQAAGEEG